jgi:hypothetical protein
MRNELDFFVDLAKDSSRPEQKAAELVSLEPAALSAELAKVLSSVMYLDKNPPRVAGSETQIKLDVLKPWLAAYTIFEASLKTRLLGAYPGIQSNWQGGHTDFQDYGLYAWLERTQQWLGDEKNLSDAGRARAKILGHAQAVKA